MIDAFEKLKYLRSRPSCVWQSEQCAWSGEASGRLFATRFARYQSAFPADIASGSPCGGVQVSGSSCLNAEVGRTMIPSSATKLNASTRTPLASPSEWLNRKRIVLAPAVTLPGG